MGYYTSYTLSVLEGEENLICKLREENESGDYALDEYGQSTNSCKWYSCQNDLVEFSNRHPKTLFLLEGIGEEPNDEWQLYILEGQVQRCVGQMVFPKFDKLKLLSDVRDSKINKVLDK